MNAGSSPSAARLEEGGCHAFWLRAVTQVTACDPGHTERRDANRKVTQMDEAVCTVQSGPILAQALAFAIDMTTAMTGILNPANNINAIADRSLDK
jgi:hypothetical protein